jgi:hypothetical protein
VYHLEKSRGRVDRRGDKADRFGVAKAEANNYNKKEQGKNEANNCMRSLKFEIDTVGVREASHAYLVQARTWYQVRTVPGTVERGFA